MAGKGECQDSGPSIHRGYDLRAATGEYVGELADPLVDPGRDRTGPGLLDQFERRGERARGDRAEISHRPCGGGGIRRPDLVVEQPGVTGTGPARQYRVHPLQCSVRQHGEPGSPSSAQPLLATHDEDVRDLPRFLGDAEALDAVDNEQPVADDVAQGGQIGAVAGAEVDRADAYRGDLVGQPGRDSFRRDIPVGQPPDDEPAVLLGTRPRVGVGGELRGRHQHFAAEVECRLEQAEAGVREQHNVVGIRPRQS